jgi:hypothetical protein
MLSPVTPNPTIGSILRRSHRSHVESQIGGPFVHSRHPGRTAAEIRIGTCAQEEEQGGNKMDEVASRGEVQKYALCYIQLRTALRNLGVRRDILHGQH